MVGEPVQKRHDATGVGEDVTPVLERSVGGDYGRPMLIAPAVRTIVPVSSCRVAEATKLLENTFRAVNIALVNELKEPWALISGK